MALFNFRLLLMLCYLPFAYPVPVRVLSASNAKSISLNNGPDLTPLVYHIPNTRKATPFRTIFLVSSRVGTDETWSQFGSSTQARIAELGSQVTASTSSHMTSTSRPMSSNPASTARASTSRTRSPVQRAKLTSLSQQTKIRLSTDRTWRSMSHGRACTERG